MRKCGLHLTQPLNKHDGDEPRSTVNIYSKVVCRSVSTTTPSPDGFSKPRTSSRTRFARDGSATSAPHSRASCLQGTR